MPVLVLSTRHCVLDNYVIKACKTMSDVVMINGKVLNVIFMFHILNYYQLHLKSQLCRVFIFNGLLYATQLLFSMFDTFPSNKHVRVL